MDKEIESLRGRKANILDHERASISAVLLPLVDYEGEMSVLFEKRSPMLRQQPGEICFPGGRIEDTDDDHSAAACRETCEELGLTAQDIDLIAPLDILISPFNAITYPFVGYIRDYRKIKINHEEVEEIFCVPLCYLIENRPINKKMSVKVKAPDDFPFELIPQGRQYPFRESVYPQQFYLWKDYVIWGMTARILTHFLRLIKNTSSSR